MVVVIEEQAAERSASWMEPNRPGKAGQYFEGLEVGLGIGVVVTHMATAVVAGDAEVDQQTE